MLTLERKIWEGETWVIPAGFVLVFSVQAGSYLGHGRSSSSADLWVRRQPDDGLRCKSPRGTMAFQREADEWMLPL